MRKFSELNIKPQPSALEGDKIKMHNVFNKTIVVEKFEIKESKFTEKGNSKCLYMQVIVDNRKRVVFTGSVSLQDMIQQVPTEAFPFQTTIIKNDNERYEFT